MTIKNKVVVITGASSGIGRATAEKLAQSGAKVVIGARRVERLKEIANEFPAGQVLFQQTDVTDRESVNRLVKLATDNFERVDVLYNNAA